MLLTIAGALEQLDYAAKVVSYYHQVEADIRRICEPYTKEDRYEDITQAHEDAAQQLEAYLPVDHVTSMLLVGMFFENYSH